MQKIDLDKVAWPEKINIFQWHFNMILNVMNKKLKEKKNILYCPRKATTI